jgi:hypothetical protein
LPSTAWILPDVSEKEIEQECAQMALGFQWNAALVGGSEAALACYQQRTFRQLL